MKSLEEAFVQARLVAKQAEQARHGEKIAGLVAMFGDGNVYDEAELAMEIIDEHEAETA